MNRERAREAIDKAADDDFAGMFNNLRINADGEPRDKALAQYAVGVRSLKRDIDDAKAVIDQVFPE